MEYIKFKKLGNGYVLVNYNTFKQLNPLTFDEVWSFHNEIARVKKEGKGFNFINEQGELLWKEDIWFDNVSYFSEGFALVNKEGKGWNWINTNGELLWKEEEWFNKVWDFRKIDDKKLAGVYKEGKGYTYINEQGELIYKGDKWVDYLWDLNSIYYDEYLRDFYEGFALNK